MVYEAEQREQRARGAVVTGAASGIGRALALGFAHAGFSVIAADYHQQDLLAMQQEAAQQGLSVATQVADMRNQADIQRLFEFVRQRGLLQAVVHCAGVTAHRSFLHTSADEYHNLLATNLSGSFFCLQEAAQQMIVQRAGGAIVVVTSINVYRPLASQAVYTATKAAIDSLVRTLASEVGQYRIRVNAIAPGAIDTPMNRTLAQADQERLARRIPLGRIGTPDDLVGPALFLVSDAARYITGTTLVVDGGYMVTR